MANPSPQAIQIIQSHVTDWTPDNATLAANLNALTAANPVPIGTVPQTVHSSNVMAYLSPASLANVNKSTAFPDIRSDIKAGHVPEMIEWIYFSVGCGDITQAEAQAIIAYIMTPVPDPNYQATVPVMLGLIGRTVDADDMQAARPVGGGS